ncbi:MAG TPA: hypothetical protein PLN52_00520 [Opitutaceae bacterium]|nr:hypothetical protein [Opitutaceae bacterium]
MKTASASSDFWICPRRVSAQRTQLCLSLANVDASWRPLGRSWTGEGFDTARGWARVQWQDDVLVYDMVFVGGRATNEARTLNELTWELGDVSEIFAQVDGRAEYIEVHVTPENQRLQLLFPHGAIERVRSAQVRLADYFIEDPEWVQSWTRVEQDFWSVHVQIPASRFHLDRFKSGQILQTAVCRYDCTLGATAVISSTAPFKEASFHRHAEWTPLALVDG